MQLARRQYVGAPAASFFRRDLGGLRDSAKDAADEYAYDAAWPPFAQPGPAGLLVALAELAITFLLRAPSFTSQIRRRLVRATGLVAAALDKTDSEA